MMSFLSGGSRGTESTCFHYARSSRYFLSTMKSNSRCGVESKLSSHEFMCKVLLKLRSVLCLALLLLFASFFFFFLLFFLFFLMFKLNKLAKIHIATSRKVVKFGCLFNLSLSMFRLGKFQHLLIKSFYHCQFCFIILNFIYCSPRP